MQQENTPQNFEFDLSRPRIFVIVGRCGSGKSVAMRCILKDCAQKGLFAFGRVYTSTKQMNTEWSSIIPSKHIFDNYSDAHLKQYINKLKEWKIKNKKPLPPSFLIFDDLLAVMNIHSPLLKWFFSVHRHWNITIFLSSQHLVSSVSTMLRTLTDYAIVFANRFKRDRKQLCAAFGQLLEDENDFLRMLDSLKKHEAILYDSHAMDAASGYIIWKAALPDRPFRLDY